MLYFAGLWSGFYCLSYRRHQRLIVTESSVFGLIFIYLVINDLLTLFSHFFVETSFKQGHVRKHSVLWWVETFFTKLSIIKLKYFQPLSQHTSKFSSPSIAELEQGVKYIKY